MVLRKVKVRKDDVPADISPLNVVYIDLNSQWQTQHYVTPGNTLSAIANKQDNDFHPRTKAEIIGGDTLNGSTTTEHGSCTVQLVLAT